MAADAARRRADVDEEFTRRVVVMELVLLAVKSPVAERRGRTCSRAALFLRAAAFSVR